MSSLSRVLPAVLFLSTAFAQASKPLPVASYRIAGSFTHDREAFTQGLAIDGGVLYEGTGLIGDSAVRKIDWASGKVLQEVRLPRQYSGEGVTLWKNRVIQLTGRQKIGFVYDKDTLRQLRTFTYAIVARTITSDGKRLIVCDGSTLYFWDPETFRETGKIAIHEGGRAVSNIGDLEFVRGEIYANYGQSYRIARISPATGQIVGWIDLKGILSAQERTEADIMFGIAYNPQEDRLLVTGRYWPKLFHVRVVPGP